jgi:hypothetical protein
LYQQQGQDHNHLGVQAVVDSLRQIAIAWREQFPQELVLHINDVSLAYGGLFDVGGGWQCPHQRHRTGRDADIRTELPGTRQGIPVRTPRNETNWQITALVGNPEFERICRRRGAGARIHLRRTDGEHYHLEF